MAVYEHCNSPEDLKSLWGQIDNGEKDSGLTSIYSGEKLLMLQIDEKGISFYSVALSALPRTMLLTNKMEFIVSSVENGLEYRDDRLCRAYSSFELKAAIDYARKLNYPESCEKRKLDYSDIHVAKPTSKNKNLSFILPHRPELLIMYLPETGKQGYLLEGGTKGTLYKFASTHFSLSEIVDGGSLYSGKWTSECCGLNYCVWIEGTDGKIRNSQLHIATLEEIIKDMPFLVPGEIEIDGPALMRTPRELDGVLAFYNSNERKATWLRVWKPEGREKFRELEILNEDSVPKHKSLRFADSAWGGFRKEEMIPFVEELKEFSARFYSTKTKDVLEF
jgi:hypothetical protein